MSWSNGSALPRGKHSMVGAARHAASTARCKQTCAAIQKHGLPSGAHRVLVATQAEVAVAGGQHGLGDVHGAHLGEQGGRAAAVSKCECIGGDPPKFDDARSHQANAGARWVWEAAGLGDQAGGNPNLRAASITWARPCDPTLAPPAAARGALPTLESSIMRTRPSVGRADGEACSAPTLARTRTAAREAWQHGQPGPWAAPALRENLLMEGAFILASILPGGGAVATGA